MIFKKHVIKGFYSSVINSTHAALSSPFPEFHRKFVEEKNGCEKISHRFLFTNRMKHSKDERENN